MIPLVPLDEFIEKNIGDKEIQLIKMDTEGSEIDILRSGLSIFNKGKVITLTRIGSSKNLLKEWIGDDQLCIELGSAGQRFCCRARS